MRWRISRTGPRPRFTSTCPRYRTDLGTQLYPQVLALDADPASIFVREHILDFSAMPPARHRAYAFQWFTFAVAAVVILLVLHRRRPTKPSDKS